MANTSFDADLARVIDHTILKADATSAEIEAFCSEALAHGFASVCVNSCNVPAVAARLAGSPVATCAVVGFPLGQMASAAKAAEAAIAVDAGAREIDMVIDIGALKDKRDAVVRDDIARVKHACGDALLKVIIETCLLDDEQKERACALAVVAGADFVKTSTGFSSAGATVADVALMRRVVGPALGVKASGGIRTAEAARAMLAAGASRIGASASVAIVTSVSSAGTGY